MEMLAMRIVCSLVSVTVIFQLERFIILNVNYRNVCSSNRPQLRVLPGSSISAPWRVDFRNWQVDYCLNTDVRSSFCFRARTPVRWQQLGKRLLTTFTSYGVMHNKICSLYCCQCIAELLITSRVPVAGKSSV